MDAEWRKASPNVKSGQQQVWLILFSFKMHLQKKNEYNSTHKQKQPQSPLLPPAEDQRMNRRPAKLYATMQQTQNCKLEVDENKLKLIRDAEETENRQFHSNPIPYSIKNQS